MVNIIFYDTYGMFLKSLIIFYYLNWIICCLFDFFTFDIIELYHFTLFFIDETEWNFKQKMWIILNHRFYTLSKMANFQWFTWSISDVNFKNDPFKTRRFIFIDESRYNADRSKLNIA